MDVSIIVPIYKGNKYINSIIQMVKRNIGYNRNMGESLEVELIFVNDYPAMPIEKNGLLIDDFKTIVIENNKNSGIHQSRVNGLIKAQGDYIIFLDQDDEIYDNCIYSQYKHVQGYDLVVGNGYRCINGKYRKIYNTRSKHMLCCKKKYYIKAANQIISPGHCLIKKSSIPRSWYEQIILENGSDDIFLWLLMLENNSKITINDDCIYCHVETGENLSNNIKSMIRSSQNVIDICLTTGVVDKRTVSTYKRRIDFMKKLQTKSLFKKIVACILNIDICLAKLYAYYV